MLTDDLDYFFIFLLLQPSDRPDIEDLVCLYCLLFMLQTLFLGMKNLASFRFYLDLGLLNLVDKVIHRLEESCNGIGICFFILTHN